MREEWYSQPSVPAGPGATQEKSFLGLQQEAVSSMAGPRASSTPLGGETGVTHLSQPHLVAGLDLPSVSLSLRICKMGTVSAEVRNVCGTLSHLC